MFKWEGAIWRWNGERKEGKRKESKQEKWNQACVNKGRGVAGEEKGKRIKIDTDTNSI